MASIVISAKFVSKCACCGGVVQKGEDINYAKGTPVTHVNCEDSMAARAYGNAAYGVAAAKGYKPPSERGSARVAPTGMAFDAWSDADANR